MTSRPTTYRVSAVQRKGTWTISYAGRRTATPPPQGRTIEEAKENARKAISAQFRISVDDVQVIVVSRDDSGPIVRGCALVFSILIFPFMIDVAFTGGVFTSAFVWWLLLKVSGLSY